MKTRYKLLLESYNVNGVIAFIFNALQSVLSDFLFGISYFYIFDYLKKGSKSLIFMIISIIFIFIYFIFLIPLWGYLMEKCENRYRVKLGKYLFENKLKSRYVEGGHSSQFLSLLQYDTEKSSKIAGWNLVVFFQAIIAGTVSTVVIGTLSIKMLIILYIMGILAVILDMISSHYIGKITGKNRIYFEERLKYFIDFVNNILLIKIYNQENKFREKINRISDKIIKNNIKLNIFENITIFINNIIYLIGFKGIVIIFGLKLIVQNKLTFGELLLIFSMINGIIFVAEYMGEYIKTLKKIGISNKRIDDYIEKNKTEEKRETIKFEKIRKIELKNIKFSYDKDKKEIFNDLNITFQFPNNYVILGDNGSGKSTLLSLIFGLRKPVFGEIYINEKLLNKENDNTFPFALVPQQVSIYDGDIMENLKMSKKDVSETDIIKATETAEIKNWIDSLEKRIYTEINEKGKNISKGEKVRLAIARELIKSPEILFLDEPDANIDKNTMENIFENIRKNYPSLNLVVITHQSKADIYKDFEKTVINKQLTNRKDTV